jgi:hypothetical protein
MSVASSAGPLSLGGAVFDAVGGTLGGSGDCTDGEGSGVGSRATDCAVGEGVISAAGGVSAFERHTATAPIPRAIASPTPISRIVSFVTRVYSPWRWDEANPGECERGPTRTGGSAHQSSGIST